MTFADLMGLLMSFFVMLVAFSNEDQTKANMLAGSMHDAFGVQNLVRYSGTVEVAGLPTRSNMKQVRRIPPEEASANIAPPPKGKIDVDEIRSSSMLCKSSRFKSTGKCSSLDFHGSKSP